MSKHLYKKEKHQNKFPSWLKTNGAKFTDIYIKTYDKNERGVYTKKKIQSQNMVIKIPRRLLIYSNMGKDTEWGKLVSKNPEGISAIKLIYLCLYMLQDMNSDNFFGEYYNILPTRLHNFPIFWTEEEKKYLECSYLLVELKIRREILTKDYHKLSTILKEHDFSTICSLQQFIQLRTLIGSRNFALWIDGEKQPTMVPLGDMLNHSSKPDIKWVFEEASDAFTMYSKHQLGNNQELTDSYGVKCNRSYLIFYGFALRNNDDGRNTIFLTLTPPNSVFDTQNLRQQLISGSFSRNISSDFNSLNFRAMMNFLRISNANEQELLAFSKNPQLAQNPYSKRNEAAALSYLALKIHDLMSTYPLSLAQNKKNLKTMPEFSNKSFATILVMGEKKIMCELLKFTKMTLGILLMNNRVSHRHLKNSTNGYILTLQSITR
jgi:hypothetical protein